MSNEIDKYGVVFSHGNISQGTSSLTVSTITLAPEAAKNEEPVTIEMGKYGTGKPERHTFEVIKANGQSISSR
ncbi:MAG: hypothetical protein ABRQ23_00230 [Syntrophomonadaceae bacterium]